VRQAVQPHLEPHQFRRADLAHDFVGARHLVLADQGAHFRLGPLDALGLALDDPLPGLRGVRIRQEQERPGLRRRRIIEFAERRRAKRGRALGGIRQHVNPEPVGIVVVLVLGAINALFQRHDPGQLRAEIRRPQIAVHLRQLPEKLRRHGVRVQRAGPLGLQFLHQVAQHHLQHRQHHAKLNGRGLHARRAGNGHRPGRQIDLLNARLLDDLAAPLHMLAQDLIRVVIDKIDLGPHLHPLPGGADHKRRLAAFGDGKNRVPGRNPQVANLLLAELREILESLHRFDEREVSARHHAERAVLELLRRRLALQAARALLLPEIAPDGNQLNAQPPGGAAPGEKHLPAPLHHAQHGIRNLPRPPRLRKFPVLAHIIPIGLEQQPQTRSHVAFGRFAQVGGDGMGGFSRKDPQLKLVANLEEVVGSLIGCLAHERCCMFVMLRSFAGAQSAGRRPPGQTKSTRTPKVLETRARE